MLQVLARSSNLVSLAVPRTGHAATALADGRVLITGGRDSAGTIVATAEVFDPANQTSTAIGVLNTARIDHTATLLADGRVLIAGGTSASGALTSAEIFDPANPGAGFRVLSATMGAARAGHTATRLHDGTVLIAGGDAAGTAEIFKPTTESFSSTLLGHGCAANWPYCHSIFRRQRFARRAVIPTRWNISRRSIKRSRLIPKR